MANGVVITDTITALRDWLETSAFAPGARLPSERQLIGVLGLKHNAINRAMGRLIAEGIVQREGYRLFFRGAAAPQPATFTCDLVLARRSLLVRSYRKVARDLGIGLRLHYYESTEEAVGHLHVLATDAQCESVLFDPSHMDESELWSAALIRLSAHGKPAASIRQYCDDVSCVLADYARAVEMACLHLNQAGHRELALVTILPRAPVAIEIHQVWESLGRQPDRRSSAARIAYYSDAREDIRPIATKLANEWKNVTALVIYAEHTPIVPHLLAELTKQKINVPRDLSLVCLGDLSSLATSSPPITAVAFDTTLMQETAFRLGQRLVRKQHEVGVKSPISCIRIQPHFVARGSLSSVTSDQKAKQALKAERSLPTAKTKPAAVESPVELRRTLMAMWKRPYSLTAIATPDLFKSIDLAPFFNRPLNFRKGWLGDLPLTHLAAGTHTIHGVPFQVFGGHSRKDRGAVVFRSMNNETGNAQTLPSSVTIPIGEKAASIYVLHGCGYARYLNRFATYEFYAGKKRLGSVPLVTLGRPPPGYDTAQFERDTQQANIQDWWPDYTHIDYKQARRVPIVERENESAVQRHVYLYTLEWKNPFPNLTVTHLKITADASQSTTLGVLAVSVLNKQSE
ncbi:MAG: substrate-binding domain-containing protein [Rariglobus sp.]